MTQSVPAYVPSLLTLAVLLLAAGVARSQVKQRHNRKKEQLGSAAAPTELPLPPPHETPPAARPAYAADHQFQATPANGTERFTPEFLKLLDAAISNAENRPNWPLQVSGTPRTTGGNVNIIITFTPQQPKT